MEVAYLLQLTTMPLLLNAEQERPTCCLKLNKVQPTDSFSSPDRLLDGGNNYDTSEPMCCCTS